MRRFILCVLLCGCGTSSVAPGGSEFDDDTGSSTTSDSSTTTDDTGGTTVTDTGGTTPTDSTTPPDDTAGGCPTLTGGTQAVHVMMNVTWPGTVGTEGGSGVVHVWTRSKFTVTGTNLTATNSPCGSQIPEIVKTPVAGGGKVLAEFPGTIWNSTAMPTFMAMGTTSGFAVGSKVTMTASPVIVGTTLADPNGAWPAASAIVGADHDGDGKPGITSVPRNGGGYTLPPTSLLRTNSADKLYIASRTTSALDGTRDTCTSTKGTATIKNFDNHVIGCHIAGGGECSKSDSDFIDTNRTVYSVKSATFETKMIADGSNCDAVRAALPAK